MHTSEGGRKFWEYRKDAKFEHIDLEDGQWVLYYPRSICSRVVEIWLVPDVDLDTKRFCKRQIIDVVNTELYVRYVSWHAQCAFRDRISFECVHFRQVYTIEYVKKREIVIQPISLQFIVPDREIAPYSECRRERFDFTFTTVRSSWKGSLKFIFCNDLITVPLTK